MGQLKVSKGRQPLIHHVGKNQSLSPDETPKLHKHTHKVNISQKSELMFVSQSVIDSNGSL